MEAVEINGVLVFRQIMDHAAWKDEWVLKLFLWCCLKAAEKDCFIKDRKVFRGQFLTARSVASDELGVSPSKWYRGMQALVEMGTITIDNAKSCTVVTVVNYSKYQGSSATAGAKPYPESPADKSNSGAERMVAKFRFPPKYDTPEVRKAVLDWAEYFFAKEGRQVTDLKLMNAMEIAMRNGWDASKIVHSIQFSIAKDAKSWCDPANDFDKKPKTRREHMAEPASSVLVDSIRGAT